MEDNRKGSISFTGQIILWVLAVFLVLTFVPIINIGTYSSNIQSATDLLTSRGYVVLASGEYALIAKEATAAAAVDNAEAAVIASQQVLDTLLLHNENLAYLYPEVTTQNVVVTSGNGVDTWSNWNVVTDGVTSLSAKITANAGLASYVYLSEITFREYATPDIMSIIEIAYGADKVVVGRTKVRSDFTWVLTILSAKIPVGQEIYYRMKSELALEHANIDIRYYYD